MSSTYKKPFHRRHDSGELDVFEAARYFSGGTEITSLAPEYKRISLDMPHMRNSIPSHPHGTEKQTKEKTYKQPSSPGGRLASFLNSLFNQTKSSKKKKSKPSTTQSVKDEDESPCGRRKRRSSISHFRSGSAPDTKSFYSSSSSGFRTPPPYVKAYKDLRSYSDHKQIVSLPKYSSGNNIATKPSSNDIVKRITTTTTTTTTTPCLDDEEFKFSTNGLFLEKLIKSLGDGFSEEKGFRKFNDDDDDDGGDSDSSSDLFELANYDLGYYSSGLPVYETTRIDSIKRGAPISSGAI